jgi:hypothetical protein
MRVVRVSNGDTFLKIWKGEAPSMPTHELDKFLERLVQTKSFMSTTLQNDINELACGYKSGRVPGCEKGSGDAENRITKRGTATNARPGERYYPHRRTSG